MKTYAIRWRLWTKVALITVVVYTVAGAVAARRNFEPLRKAAGADRPMAMTVADMETKLIEMTAVTDDEFRALMQDRAIQVQGYLLQTGQLTGERLSITEPKPGTEGSNRVNFSLR